MLAVATEKGRLDSLIKQLENVSSGSASSVLAGQRIAVHPIALSDKFAREHEGGSNPITKSHNVGFNALLTVKRSDRTGIVFDVVKLLSEYNINICNLSTESERNPSSGDQEFRLVTGIHCDLIPSQKHLDELVEQIRDKVGGDVELEIENEANQ